MVNRRKDRQKLLMTDELFDKIGHEYKEDKPINTNLYEPVDENVSQTDFLELASSLEDATETSTTQPVTSKKPSGRTVLALILLFLLISLLSIATIVIILVRGGV